MLTSLTRRVLDLSLRLDTRVTRFLLVGATGVGVNTSVFWVATRWVGAGAVAAGFLATVLSTGSNFLLNDAFTWRDRRTAGPAAWAGRMVRYYVTTVVGNAVYLAVLAALVHGVQLFDLLANLIAIGVGGSFNYLIHNVWTWRRRSP